MGTERLLSVSPRCAVLGSRAITGERLHPFYETTISGSNPDGVISGRDTHSPLVLQGFGEAKNNCMSGFFSVDAFRATDAFRASPRFRIVREGDAEGDGTIPAPSLAEELLADYQRCEVMRASPAQLRANVSAVRRFTAARRLGDPRDATAPDVEDWMADLVAGKSGRCGRPPAAKTIRNHVASLGAFYGWMKRRKLIEDNPVADVEIPTMEDPPHIYLHEGELARALEIAEANGIYCEVVLAAYAGLRMGELQRLRWADVDLPGKCVLVLKAKGRRRRTKWRRMWLHPMALAALATQKEKYLCSEWVFPGGRHTGDGRPAGGTWTRNQPRGREKWLALLKPLQDVLPAFQALPKGSTGRGWHLLRHTFASLGLQHGIRMEEISGFLGHSSIATTERHYAWLKEGYNPAIEKL